MIHRFFRRSAAIARSPSRFLQPIDVVLLLGFFMVVWTIEANGISKAIPAPSYRNTASIAIAVSEMKFGTTGYRGYQAVYDDLARHGLDEMYRTRPLTPEFIPERSRALANSALRWMTTHAPVTREPLIVRHNEVGLVDWYRLAFWLFGFRVEALAYLWYGFVAVVVLAFIVSFRGDMSFLKGICLLALVLYLESSLRNWALPPGSRSYPGLSLLCTIYLACLSWSGARPRSVNVGFATAVSAIFAFCLIARILVAWQLVMVLAMALAVAAQRLFGIRRLGFQTLRNAVIWPLLLVTVISVGAKLYVEHRKDALYVTETAAGHPAWLVFFVAYGGALDFMLPDLSASSRFNAENADSFGDALIGEAISARDEPLEGYMLPNGEGWIESKRDAMAKKAFFDIWSRYPLPLLGFVARQVFIDLPKFILETKLSLMSGGLLAAAAVVLWPAARHARNLVRSFCGLVSSSGVFVVGNVVLIPVYQVHGPDVVALGAMVMLAVVGLIVIRPDQPARRDAAAEHHQEAVASPQ